ncbi:MAG: DUF4445 domain-containing protein [Ignavibacteriaceae bacterium]|nr:DUF4445 domain-containing protein [Ignavibacteriaceae bacterium]
MSVDLRFNNNDYKVEPGFSLFEYANLFGIQIPTSCNKQGKCKECLVEINSGMENLSNRLIEEKHLENRFRLSCCTRIIKDGCSVSCHTMHRGKMRIENKSELQNLNFHAQKIEPSVKRKGDKIYLDTEQIDCSQLPIYGIALDLGTTTVVIRLINLETGLVVADTAFENPQKFGGSDVMARIHYDSIHKGKLLNKVLIGYLNHAIKELPVNPHSIYEMVIAGNSTMRDLFFRESVYSIGQSPYQSVTEIELINGSRTTTSISKTAQELNIVINPKARVYGLPIISGHVGADTAACMLALNIANEEKLVAIMDIGTNTELVLGNRNKIYAASCPAGPAFEGGNISCGMPALTGAIEKIKFLDNSSILLKVIDEVQAEGICGSGLVELLSELLRTNRINSLGRFNNGANEIIVYSDENKKIYLTENDISQLAQAKGANTAGLHTIFNNFGIEFNDVDYFYLAGAFGKYLDIEASKRIGLIPDIENDKIKQVGNASIDGASIALLSITKRKEIEELMKKVTHCRLETDPSFFHYFVEGCHFKSMESLK